MTTKSTSRGIQIDELNFIESKDNKFVSTDWPEMAAILNDAKPPKSPAIPDYGFFIIEWAIEWLGTGKAVGNVIRYKYPDPQPVF